MGVVDPVRFDKGLEDVLFPLVQLTTQAESGLNIAATSDGDPDAVGFGMVVGLYPYPDWRKDCRQSRGGKYVLATRTILGIAESVQSQYGYSGSGALLYHPVGRHRHGAGQMLCPGLYGKRRIAGDIENLRLLNIVASIEAVMPTVPGMNFIN
jgi:hypothetical protein